MMLHNKMKKDYALFSKEHQRVQDQDQLKDKLWTLTNDIKSVDQKVMMHKRIADEHKKQIDDKVPKSELKRTEKIIQTLPTSQDIQIWKKRLDDQNKEFKKTQEQFKIDFKIQNEIIARYDEVLNERANKHTVRELDKQ